MLIDDRLGLQRAGEGIPVHLVACSALSENMENNLQGIAGSVNEYLEELERILPFLALRMDASALIQKDPLRGVSHYESQNSNLSDDWQSSIEIIEQVAVRVAEIQDSYWRSAENARQIVEEAIRVTEGSRRREEQALALVDDLHRRLLEAADREEGLRLQIKEALGRAAAAEQMLATSHYYLSKLYRSLPKQLDGPRSASQTRT